MCMVYFLLPLLLFYFLWYIYDHNPIRVIHIFHKFIKVSMLFHTVCYSLKSFINIFHRTSTISTAYSQSNDEIKTP